jgi:hypothetical protein
MLNRMAERMNIPLGVLISPKRDNRTAFARQLGYYRCRKHAHASFLCIGESFNRDHSSIIHSVKAIAGRMEAEPAFRLTVKRIEHDLGLFSQALFKTVTANTHRVVRQAVMEITNEKGRGEGPGPDTRKHLNCKGAITCH